MENSAPVFLDIDRGNFNHMSKTF
ncbi:uncharacterized protein METZ01_LOCUS98641 [marine metagenome]|uniref:Uncharacterized protein n=1 Tax=marine metagenome TaxID=408172 RepID=A0A381W1L1_9ZZZZ